MQSTQDSSVFIDFVCLIFWEEEGNIVILCAKPFVDSDSI